MRKKIEKGVWNMSDVDKQKLIEYGNKWIQNIFRGANKN